MSPWILASLVLTFGIGPDTLEAVDLYGLRTVSERSVRTAVGLAAGDPTPRSVDSIRVRLLGIPGVAAVDVSLVCCGERGGSLLYLGIREHGIPPLTFRVAPGGNARLPERLTALGARFESALVAAVQRGAADEDDSQGYALAADSSVRSTQEAFRHVAISDFDTLVRVLRTSEDVEHRALAAQIIAYGTDRQAVLRELLHAIDDPSEGVRNNATRALALLARWAQQHPDSGLNIPVDPFVEMLNSVSWTDRNKGVIALMPLTADRPKALLSILRERALPSLIEMARWSSTGHALAPYIILARVAGVEDREAFESWQAGDRQTVIVRAQTAARDAPTAPR